MSDRPKPVPLWICVAWLSAIFLVMLAWTWMGWCDPIVDFGRELYVPWRLGQGAVLYRDIAYFNGPLSPYFNALIFKLFGPSLHVLMTTNLVLLALFSTMLFAVAARAFGRFAALVGTTVQLTILSFIQLAGIGNYNFVTPYSHELTHGLLLSLVLMYQLLPPSACTRGEGGGEGLREQGLTNDEERRSTYSLVRSLFVGLLLGLIFLTKIEVFLAAAGAAFACVFLRATIRSHRSFAKRHFRSVAFIVIGFLLPPLIASLLLRFAMPSAEAFHGLLGSFAHAFDPQLTGNAFYRKILGTDDLPAHLAHLLLAAAVTAVMLIAFALPAKLRSDAHRWLAIGGAWIAVIVGYFAIDPQWWQTAFAGLPLLLLMVLIVQLRTFWRDRSAKALTPLAFTLFAELLLAKMLLNVRLSQYGFALAGPGMLALIGFCFAEIPQWFDARGDRARWIVRAYLPLAALLIAVHLRPFATIFSDKPLAVGSGGDRFFTADLQQTPTIPPHLFGDPRGRAVNQCLAQFQALPADATVAVVPEGAMLNYLAKRVNPTKYINLMPPEVLMFGESNILQDFQQHPPTYIVINDGSDPGEYGYRSFSDYAPGLSAWLAGNYEATNNPTPPAYSLRILKHRPSTSMLATP